jgi:hypothetical protein
MVSCKKIFGRIRYLAIASIVTGVVFSSAVWLPNFALIKLVFATASISLVDKFSLLLSLYVGIITNFTILAALYTVSIAVLCGLYVAMLIFYLTERRQGSVGAKSTGWFGLGGVISGFFGIGCAACGTFIFTSIFTAGGAGSLILLLPLAGQEFGLLGAGLLVYAVYSLGQKIKEPLVCT